MVATCEPEPIHLAQSPEKLYDCPVSQEARMSRERSRAGRPARSEAQREAKRQAILDAALDVFAEKGFAETRLDDVALRAGVAKGTIYLYVSSKEELFEALIRAGIGTPIGRIEEQIVALDPPFEQVLRMLLTFLRTEVLGTRRREIVRLLLMEAGRFPAIAELYHREVVARGMGLLRRVAQRAYDRGELRSDELVRFPQLAVAPGLVALLWSHLFERFEPLDMDGLFEAHLALLMRGLRTEAS
jgi:AcrR family transcriptional regulator